MNKKQVAKRTKRALRSKQKKKERNIEKTRKKISEAKRKEKLVQFFDALSTSQKRKILKDKSDGKERSQ